MRLSRITGSRTAVAAIGVVGVLAAGGTAYAATGTGSGTPTTNPSARSHSRSLLARADHATVEVKAKGQWVTYTLDRGKVTAVSPSSITLARPDGQTVTDTINSGTRFVGVGSESAVQLNRSAEVVSEGGVAVRVRQGAGARAGSAATSVPSSTS